MIHQRLCRPSSSMLISAGSDRDDTGKRWSHQLLGEPGYLGADDKTLLQQGLLEAHQVSSWAPTGRPVTKLVQLIREDAPVLVSSHNKPSGVVAPCADSVLGPCGCREGVCPPFSFLFSPPLLWPSLVLFVESGGATSASLGPLSDGPGRSVCRGEK